MYCNSRVYIQLKNTFMEFDIGFKEVVFRGRTSDSFNVCNAKWIFLDSQAQVCYFLVYSIKDFAAIHLFII